MKQTNGDQIKTMDEHERCLISIKFILFNFKVLIPALS